MERYMPMFLLNQPLKCIFILLFCVQILRPGITQAQLSASPRVILIAFKDTEGLRLREGLRYSYQQMVALADYLARAYGQDRAVIAGDTIAISVAGIHEAIQGLSISPQDLVIFYYIGHGYENTQHKGIRNLFPSIPSRTPRRALTYFSDLIWQRNPKILLCITDACSGQPLVRGTTLMGVDTRPRPAPSLERFSTLFPVKVPEQRLRVHFTAARRKAYIQNSGGFFTDCFVNAMYRVFQQETTASSLYRWCLGIEADVYEQVRHARKVNGTLNDLCQRYGIQRPYFELEYYTQDRLKKRQTSPRF